MNRKLTLKIKRRSQPGWLCWLLIVLPFLFGTLGFPGSLRYTMDAVWLALLVIMLVYRKSIAWRNLSGLILWVTCFLLFSALAYLPQYQSGLYYLWGVRNNFRYYAAFFAFCVFLSGSDVEGYFRLFDKLFWINLIVSVVQFVFLEKEGDYLGGIFCTQKGGNGYTNIFFCIILTKSIIYYLEKKESLRTCAWKFAAAMVVAATAELKFFFAEAVLILILAVLFTDFSWRKVLIIAGGLAGVAAGAALLVVIFPDFAGFFTGRWLWNNAVSAAGYTSSGDMNRLNAIGVANELFLKNGWMRLFGMGMGNCETSAFAYLNSPFFERFGALHLYMDVPCDDVSGMRLDRTGLLFWLLSAGVFQSRKNRTDRRAEDQFPLPHCAHDGGAVHGYRDLQFIHAHRSRLHGLFCAGSALCGLQR